MPSEKKVYHEYLLGEALKIARIDGENVGHLFDLTTNAEENRQLELAFLDGYLSVKERKNHRDGPYWQPKKAVD
jgi:hypothetical protein